MESWLVHKHAKRERGNEGSVGLAPEYSHGCVLRNGIQGDKRKRVSSRNGEIDSKQIHWRERPVVASQLFSSERAPIFLIFQSSAVPHKTGQRAHSAMTKPHTIYGVVTGFLQTWKNSGATDVAVDVMFWRVCLPAAEILHLMANPLLLQVIKRLLLGTPPQEDHQPSDEEIEVLCRLLKTVGQQLDRPQAAAYMDHYYVRMRNLQKNHPRARPRFLLQDAIDLRANNWVPRWEEQKAQTLAELEANIARAEQEKHEGLLRGTPTRSPNAGRGTTPVQGTKGSAKRWAEEAAAAAQRAALAAQRQAASSPAHFQPPPALPGMAAGRGRGPAPGAAPAASPAPAPASPVSTGSEAAEGEGGKPAASPSANSKPKKKQRGVSPKEPHHPQVQPEKPPAEKATATMDEASLEAIAMTMIDEFKNSVNEGDVAGLVVENFKQVCSLLTPPQASLRDDSRTGVP